MLFPALAPEPRFNRLVLLLVPPLLLTTPAAFAMPVVEGNTIVMPEDGWYQVQSSEDYTEICAGVFRCDVEDGRYIVINHSTGQRWENLGVPASQTNRVRVEGNSILMPEDGWYQVQDARTYISLCEGRTRCNVPDGHYIVINHTSGQRWESISVGTGVAPLAERITTDGNTIRIDGDGWFQVQDRNTLVSLCDGASVCEVPDGEYIVIDHTRGERVESVQVTGGPDPDGPDDALLNAGNAEAILQGVLGVLNEERLLETLTVAAGDLGGYFYNVVGEAAFNNRFPVVDTIALDPAYVPVTVSAGQPVDAVSQALLATCPNSGDVYVFRELIPDYAAEYAFNGCVIGSRQYDGSIGSVNPPARGVINEEAARDFTILDGNGALRSLSGRVSYGNPSFVVRDLQTRWQDAAVDYRSGNEFLSVDAYAVERRVYDTYQVRFVSSDSVDLPDGSSSRVESFERSARIQGSFEVSADWSQDLPLSVTVLFEFDDTIYRAERDPQFVFPGYDAELPFGWQSVTLDIQAGDSSQLRIRSVAGADNQFTISTDQDDVLGPFVWEGDYRVDCDPLDGCF